jgi:pyroglutamyl-peptidase
VILLTGFEPFTTGQGLVLDHNPTADIVQRVAEGREGVTSAVLPVSFASTRARLTALWDALQPRLWIGLGYAPHREAVEVETVALNVEHALRGDNDGVTPVDRPIVAGAPLAYRTQLDVAAAAAVFGARGFTARAGFHAGTFLCNQTFFLGCHRVETGDDLAVAAFVHVPPMGSYDAFEDALGALLDGL